MLNTSPTSPADVRYKSVAGALLFAVLLGPIGLLYASFWGGFAMSFIGMLVLSSKHIFLMALLWMSCCIWSVGAVESHNKQVFNSQQK